MPKEKGGKRGHAEEVERLTTEKVRPIIEGAGYELWDVIFEKEGAMWYLKVLFDKKDGGIDDTECEEITAPINEAVDKLPVLDLIDVLEVGSPGLGRVLRFPYHFEQMKGSPVKVTIRDENGKTIYIKGTLGEFDSNSEEFELTDDEGTKKFLLSKCRRVSLDL